MRRKTKDRNGASGLIEACYERPDLGQEGRRRHRSAEGDPVIYVAVVNQVRGDELDWVIVCALSKNRFPHGGEDSFGERCRWWVAISRPREAASYLGVEGKICTGRHG